MFFKHWVPKSVTKYKIFPMIFLFFKKYFTVYKNPHCAERFLLGFFGIHQAYFFSRIKRCKNLIFFLKNFKNWKFFMVIKKWAFFIFLLSTFILKRFVFYFLFFRIIEIRNIGWFWWLVWIKFFNSCRRVEKCRKSLFFSKIVFFRLDCGRIVVF